MKIASVETETVQFNAKLKTVNAQVHVVDRGGTHHEARIVGSGDLVEELLRLIKKEVYE